jgi:hypothetical protein
MTNLASSTIDKRCGYFVRAIVGFRGVRPDPVERLMTANCLVLGV